MTRIIGLTGKLGSGKDTVFERIRATQGLGYIRVSFADPLKDSVCALFGIDRDDMERLKREDDNRSITVWADDDYPIEMNMRTLLQRYGTESHRDIFGDNFWVDVAMKQIDEYSQKMDAGNKTFVFTDVRFPNEAEAIIERGGEIWRVIGPDNDTGDHPSEQVLDDSLIARTIDNTVRDDGFLSLDAQLGGVIA